MFRNKTTRVSKPNRLEMVVGNKLCFLILPGTLSLVTQVH